MPFKDYVYPVVLPAAHMKPEYRKMKLSSKYILARIIGLSKRCENKQLKISNSLLKYEIGFNANQIRSAFKELEELKLISIDWKIGSRRVIHLLFDIDDLRLSEDTQTVYETDSVQNEHRTMYEMNSVQNEQCSKDTQFSVQNEQCSVYKSYTHKYEYKKEEIDIYRKSIYKKILKDLVSGASSKIFMRDPVTNDTLDSFVSFNFDAKEDVDEEGQPLYTNEALDSEGYNLAAWLRTNVTYLADLVLMSKFGEQCYDLYAESLLKRWNPEKAPLGKFLLIAVINDLKGFRTKALDYVTSYIDKEVVYPIIKKHIKSRNCPSKVLDEIVYEDDKHFFTAVIHDMDLGRYVYRLMFQTINDDCEDILQPYDSNRDFPTDEEMKIEWGKKWFDAWQPDTPYKEAKETALRMLSFHKGLYNKELPIDEFFN